MQLLKDIKADRLLKANIKDAQTAYSFTREVFAENALFREVSDSVNIRFIHDEKDFVDFNIQKLLPHKLSEYGPALAVGRY